jgi:hypothetical protein
MIGLLNLLPWVAIGPIVIVNGLPEAIVSAVLTLAVVASYKQIEFGRKRGADI